MNVTEQINNFVRLNGGNERDALNVALTRLDLADAHAARLMQERDELLQEARDLASHAEALRAEDAEARAAQLEAERDELRAKLEQAQRALKEIIDLGQDSHAAFDGERWREMWKVACMNIESWRKDQ